MRLRGPPPSGFVWHSLHSTPSFFAKRLCANAGAAPIAATVTTVTTTTEAAAATERIDGCCSRFVPSYNGAMARYDDARGEIARRKWTWLVTGGAGFIGSHLVEHLVKL